VKIRVFDPLGVKKIEFSKSSPNWLKFDVREVFRQGEHESEAILLEANSRGY